MEAANARVFAFGASVGIINSVKNSFAALIASTIAVEKALVDINTVLNTSSSQLDAFGQRLFDVAKNTGQSFAIVAEGALELARQGLSTEDTLKRINDALILSRLSGLDATQAVTGLTAAFNSFKESGITTEEILNKLVVVSQKYAVSERDLIEAIKRSASVADQAGVSFDQLLGIVTVVQERTARGGAVIGNAFKTIFARLQDKGAINDLQDLGIAVANSNGEMLGATEILENLAQKFESFSKTKQADIAKKLGGVYQLSNLLAAVKDLSNEQGIYGDVVDLSSKAADEAYIKNAALNETLRAIIDKTTISAMELGATLGKIGITDSAKSLISFFNSILESIQGILDQEGFLGNLVRGLTSGLGNIISGPALALVGAIIIKLSKDLLVFGARSTKEFFGLGKAAKDLIAIEKGIASALTSNLNLQREILALEGNRVAQANALLEAIGKQEGAQRKLQAVTKDLAGSAQASGVTMSPEGLSLPNVRTAAGGYVPAVAQESASIKKGVGGAKSGDKPVVIPNFSFGGGKTGPIVAHTGEFIVPNFGNGGSAIFNRDMVRSMGMPEGAKKINAAGGFVPNFVTDVKSSIQQKRVALLKSELENSFTKVDTNALKAIGFFNEFTKRAASSSSLGQTNYDFQKGLLDFASSKKSSMPDSESVAALVFSRIGQSQMLGPNTKDASGAMKITPSGVFGIDANKIGGMGVIALSKEGDIGDNDAGKQTITKKIADDNLLGDSTAVEISNIQIRTLGQLSSKIQDNQKAFRSKIVDKFSKPLLELSKDIMPKGLASPDMEASLKSIQNGDPYLFSDNVLGGIFESATKMGVTAVGKMPEFSSVDQRGRFDFDSKIDDGFIKAFGFNNVLKADAKKIANSESIGTLVPKAFGDKQYSDNIKAFVKSGPLAKAVPKASGIPSASKGFIPNFSSSEKFTKTRNADQINWIKAAAKKLNLPLNEETFLKLGKLYEEEVSINRVDKSGKASTQGMLGLFSKGYIPNFVSQSREIGRGVQGAFYRLGEKDGTQVGVKKFFKDNDATSKSIQKEWLIAEYLNKYANIPSVYGPKNLSTLGRSMQKGSIRKEIISDPLAKTALGSGVSSVFGDSVLKSAIGTRGVHIGDLHGSNYTVNKNAENSIDELKNYPSDSVGSLRTLRNMADEGARISILDPGIAEVKDPARAMIGKIIGQQSKAKNATQGYVPNFVGRSRRMGSGEYGSFYKLSDEVGTKRFHKKTRRGEIPVETSDIVEEYANASLIANVPIVNGVTGPKVKNTIGDAIRARRIRKEIVSWPMASNSIGRHVARDVGDLIAESLHREGLSASDIHGGNFAINKLGTDWIDEGGIIPSGLRNGGDAWMSDFTTRGGKASIVDAGFMYPLSANLENYINNIKSQASQILGVDSTAKEQPSFKIRSTTKNSAQGHVPNFALDLQKSEEQLESKRKKTARVQTYRKASGTIDSSFKFIGSLLKEIPKRYIENNVLGNEGQGIQTDYIFDIIKNSSVYASKFTGPKTANFISQSRELGLKVSKSLQAKLASYATTAIGKVKGFSTGHIPNFADPIKEAVSREISAGVPASQIYLDQNESLKNPSNPMGFMVANRRDEPAGGHQGVSRAIREGRNPQTYGASNGYVPNFAEDRNELLKNTGFSAAKIKKLEKALKDLQDGMIGVSGIMEKFGNSVSLGNAQLEALAKLIEEARNQAQQSQTQTPPAPSVPPVSPAPINLPPAPNNGPNYSMGGNPTTSTSGGTAILVPPAPPVSPAPPAPPVLPAPTSSTPADPALKKTSVDFIAKVFMLQTAMAGLSGVFSNMGDEVEKVVGTFSDLTLSIASIGSFVDMFKQKGQEPASLISRAGSGNTEALTELSASGDFVTRRLAARAAAPGGGRGSSVAQGALKAIGFVGSGLSRLVPIIGIAVTAFQAFSAIAKLFNYDLATELGTALGLIDTAAEKAAKSLDKLSLESAKSALEGKFGESNITKQFQLQQKVELAKETAKDQGIKYKEGDDIPALLLQKTFERATVGFNKELLSSESGLSETEVNTLYNTSGGFRGVIDKSEESGKSKTKSTETSKTQLKALSAFNQDVALNLGSSEAKKAFAKARESEDPVEIKKAIQGLLRSVEDTVGEDKYKEIIKARETLAGLTASSSLMDLSIATKALKIAEKQVTVAKQKSRISLELAQAELDNRIAYSNALFEITSSGQAQLMIEEKLSSTSETRLASIGYELKALENRKKLTIDQAAATTSFLKDQKSLKSELESETNILGEIDEEKFNEIAVIAEQINSLILQRGSYTKEVAQEAENLLTGAKLEVKVVDALLKALAQKNSSIKDSNGLMTFSNQLEIRRNAIAEATNTALDMEKKRRLEILDIQKEALDTEEKTNSINDRIYKSRSEKLKSALPSGMSSRIDDISNARDVSNASRDKELRDRSILLDLKSELAKIVSDKNLGADLSTRVDSLTKENFQKIAQDIAAAEKKAAIEKLNAAFQEDLMKLTSATKFYDIVTKSADQVADVLKGIIPDFIKMTPEQVAKYAQKQVPGSTALDPALAVIELEDKRKAAVQAIEKAPAFRIQAAATATKAFADSAGEFSATIAELDQRFAKSAKKIEKEFESLMLGLQYEAGQVERSGIINQGRIEMIGMRKDYELENPANFAGITDPTKYLERQQQIERQAFEDTAALQSQIETNQIKMELKRELMTLDNIKALSVNTKAIEALEKAFEQAEKDRLNAITAVPSGATQTAGPSTWEVASGPSARTPAPLTTAQQNQKNLLSIVLGPQANPSSIRTPSPTPALNVKSADPEIYNPANTGSINEIINQYGQFVQLEGNELTAAIKNYVGQFKYLGEQSSSIETALMKAVDSAKTVAANRSKENEVKTYGEQLDLLRKNPKTFSQGLDKGFLDINEKIIQFEHSFGQEIPQMFSDGMSDGIQRMIEGAEDVGDIFQDIAYNLVKQINSKLISQATDSLMGGIGNFSGGGKGIVEGAGKATKFVTDLFRASGGPITGGSGTKDDVPAMLMGGEYVINKRSVGKYGPQFMEAINRGTLGGFAKGGLVQSGEQGFFTPEKPKSGSIKGERDLLRFASQSSTSGATDKIFNKGNRASINLEPESMKLTNFGRSNSPQAEATKAAKEQAFGMYVQALEQEMQAKKDADAAKKRFRTQLITMAALAAGSAAVKAGGAGFSSAMAASQNTGFSKFMDGVKGIGTGGEGFGGLSRMFSSSGYQSFIGKARIVGDIPKSGGYAQTGGYSSNVDNSLIPKMQFDNEIPENQENTPEITLRKNATGGRIPSTSGIDTVPSMLSGGEFIMNRSAAQSIGAGNLQALNAGASSIVTEEKTEELNNKLIAKLDELIEASASASNITINVESSNGASKESTNGQGSGQSQQLARQIKDAVLKVIQDEKRLGGQLRR
jgi:TP901 family phage tail tape measure protein